MPTFAFEVEYAKSGRSACKKCKGKIDKDAVRLGFKALAPEDAAENASNHFGCSWHHFACFPQAKGTAWFKKHLQADNSCVQGLGDLRPEDRAAVEQLLLACRGEAEAPGAPQPPGAAPQETPAKGGKKRKSKENDEDCAGATPAKAAKAAAASDPSAAAIADARAKLAGRNAAWLGAALAKNGLPKSGRKDELADRVAECQVLGVPPTCSWCSKKKLLWSRGTGKYSCPGYFDDEEKMFKRCKGPGDGAEVQRTPWEDL